MLVFCVWCGGCGVVVVAVASAWRKPHARCPLSQLPLTSPSIPHVPSTTSTHCTRAAAAAAAEKERQRIDPYFAMIDDSMYHPSRLSTERLKKSGYDARRVQQYLRDQIINDDV